MKYAPLFLLAALLAACAQPSSTDMTDGTSNRDLLTDIWVLETYQGEEIEAVERGPELPRLEFQVKEGRLTGTGGCNQLTGTVKDVTDDSVTFGGIAMTRKMCNQGMDLEMMIQEVLSNQTLTYRIDGGKLYLGTDWVFKKVD